MSSTILSTLERDFINNYQGNFPLQTRPFKFIAEQFGCSENELISTVQQLKKQKILTRFGPLYDASRLGGSLTLAAMIVPEQHYAFVTEQVNAYKEVAHNYRREHELNMWFVLATETPVEILQVLTSIEEKTGLKVYNFPKQQEFYIGLWLHLDANDIPSTVPVPVIAAKKDADIHNQQNSALDNTDRKLISATQSGFAIEHSPYQLIANKLGITEKEVLQRLENLQTSGIIRRIGAVPNHYKLGLTANGMTVWDVSDTKIKQLGKLVGQLGFVSHSYQRPRHLPLWHYNMFAMVHGTTKDEVAVKTMQIKELLGNNYKSHEILYSSAILKKTGLRLAA